MEKEKTVFGLTGNMGCGKSIIGEFLQKHDDIFFFDSDEIAKEILHSSQNLDQIKSILGDGVETNGKIDNKKVSQIIFSNKEKKEALEGFIHPKVLDKLFEEVRQKENDAIFVVESAILYEAGWDSKVDRVILVTCDQDEQIKRIKARNGWSDQQIEERLKSQLPNELKESKSWVIINTHCSLDELRQKTEILYSHIRNRAVNKLVL